MEHEPHSPEGGEQHSETQTAPIFEQLSDEQHIQRGIADALNEGQTIDDATARRIASHLQGGQDSALYAFASSGVLDDRLERELLESVQDRSPMQDSWIDALLGYADSRGEDRGARANWVDETHSRPKQPVQTNNESEAAESTASPEQEARPHPRIYVRCLAAYNNGILHGRWIDADQDVDTLRDEVETMLNASPMPDAEEFAIHDVEDFSGYPLGEYENLAFVSRLAQGIAQHGQAFAAYAEWIGREDRELEHFSEHFEGAHPTREAWAEEVANEIFEWPRWRESILKFCASTSGST